MSRLLAKVPAGLLSGLFATAQFTPVAVPFQGRYPIQMRLLVLALLLSAPPAQALKIGNIEISDSSHRDVKPTEVLELLVRWAYYDEAIQWIKDHPGAHRQTGYTIASLKGDRDNYQKRLSKYGLPSNTYPRIEESEHTVGPSNERRKFVVYCIRTHNKIFRPLSGLSYEQFVAVVPKTGGSLQGGPIGQDCSHKPLSTMKVPGDKLLVATVHGGMASTIYLLRLEGDNLIPVRRKDNEQDVPFKTYQRGTLGLSIRPTLSAGGETFSEFRSESSDKRTLSSEYQWNSGAYVLISSSPHPNPLDFKWDEIKVPVRGDFKLGHHAVPDPPAVFLGKRAYLRKLTSRQKDLMSYDGGEATSSSGKKLLVRRTGSKVGKTGSNTGTFEVELDGKKVYEFTAPISPVRGLVRTIAWIDDDWIVEYDNHVIVNGEDLVGRYPFSKAFFYRQVAGRPIYFAEENKKTRLVVHGTYMGKPFDYILQGWCCEIGMKNLKANDRMVWFYGKRGEEWYYVEVGAF